MATSKIDGFDKTLVRGSLTYNNCESDTAGTPAVATSEIMRVGRIVMLTLSLKNIVWENTQSAWEYKVNIPAGFRPTSQNIQTFMRVENSNADASYINANITTTGVVTLRRNTTVTNVRGTITYII